MFRPSSAKDDDVHRQPLTVQRYFRYRRSRRPRTSPRCSTAGSRFSGDKEAFRRLVDGQWTSLTWRQAAEQVEALAAGLVALGLEPEQRIGIASSTRYEWILADLADHLRRRRHHHRLPVDQRRRHRLHPARFGSRFVFAEDADQLTKLNERRADLPDL